MAWATAQDVIDRWVGDGAPSTTVADRWIGDAETLIRFEYPDLQDRIDSGAVPVEQVVLVVSRMVTRALRNPDNVRSRQVGPFGTTYAGDEPGGLMLTAEDRALLGAAGGATGGAFTIDTTPSGARDGYWAAPDTWVPL